MDPLILPASGAERLGEEIADLLGVAPVESRVDRFPDGELDVAVDPGIEGQDVYVIQSLTDPVNDRLVELLLLLDACRRESPGRVTVVVPYLAYARKDRRTGPGEAVSLRVLARLLDRPQVDRVVLVDPHIEQMESVFDVPVTVLSAVPALAAAIQPATSGEHVVIAPDAGAVNLAESFCAELELERLAVVIKERTSGAEVSTTGLAASDGETSAVLVDDMISTGGTLEAAVDAIRASWSVESLHVVATHAVLVPGAVERVLGLDPSQVITTDSIHHDSLPRSFEIVGIAGILTRAIRSLSGLSADLSESALR